MQLICEYCGVDLVVNDKYICNSCHAPIPENILGVMLFVNMSEDGVYPDTATDEEIDKWMDRELGSEHGSHA